MSYIMSYRYQHKHKKDLVSHPATTGIFKTSLSIISTGVKRAGNTS